MSRVFFRAMFRVVKINAESYARVSDLLEEMRVSVADFDSFRMNWCCLLSSSKSEKSVSDHVDYFSICALSGAQFIYFRFFIIYSGSFSVNSSALKPPSQQDSKRK